MSNIIKIYGLRTSGSNWLQWLLENNVDDIVVFRNQLAWKHGFPTTQLDWSGDIVEWDDKSALKQEYELVLNSIKNEKLINGKNVLEMKDDVESTFNSGKLIHCFIIKHPYSWMDSRINKRNKNLESEINDWNKKTKSYFDFDYPSKIIISYEKLNMNPKQEIERICEMFNLKMKSEWTDTDKNLTNGLRPIHAHRAKRQQLDSNFESHFRRKFTKQQISKIDSLIDINSLKLYNSL